MRDRSAYPGRTPRWRIAGVLLLLGASGAGAATDDATLHPACFEPYLAATVSGPGPGLRPDSPHTALRFEACNRRHADVPVTRSGNRYRYERPRTVAGASRGALVYEPLIAADGQAVYRLFENAGGSGVFSYLLTGRIHDGDARVLRNITVHPLGDRCDLGSAWLGKDGDGHPVTALALTPAALPAVLASPPGALPWPERDRTRADRAFGAALRASLSACPTCCVGEAVYRLTDTGTWTLDDLTLDTLAPFDEAAGISLSSALRALAEGGDDKFRLDAGDIKEVQRRLAPGHPTPMDTRRTQFWLQRLGYYWSAPIDGIAGPRTRTALEAFRADHPGAIERDGVATALALTGLHYTGRRLHPIDETTRDPSFARFRARLEAAVAARDGDTLIALSASDIVLGFGGSGGHRDLRQLLAHDTTRQRLWRDLEGILALGSVHVGPDAFCLPYPSCTAQPSSAPDPLDGLDPLRAVVVVAPEARLRRTPAPASATIRALDHDVMTRAPDTGPPARDAWRVRDAAGRIGYVARTAARMPIQPRMQVRRDADGWRIAWLVSGD